MQLEVEVVAVDMQLQSMQVAKVVPVS